jgi:hypothetical protein
MSTYASVGSAVWRVACGVWRVACGVPCGGTWAVGHGVEVAVEQERGAAGGAPAHAAGARHHALHVAVHVVQPCAPTHTHPHVTALLYVLNPDTELRWSIAIAFLTLTSMYNYVSLASL